MSESTDEVPDDGTNPEGPEADPAPTRTLHLAKWTTRLGAWFIDVIIVSVIVGAITTGISAIPGFGSTTGLGIDGLGLFVYWTYFEGRTGQSPGKMVLDLRVVDERGDPIDYGTSAVQALGKAFLLPIDCLIGWIFMGGEKVRLFNRVSGTIVIVDEEGSVPPEGVEYVVPKE